MSGIISAHYKRVGLSFGFLFFILALCCPGVSTALEWTTSGANIYNANSGNVGIGITSPASKLHLRGGELRVDNVGAGWVKILRGYNTTYRSTIFQGAQGLEFGTADSDTHTPRLFISSSIGNVGIGTTSPTQLLHLESAGTPAIALYSSFTGDSANRNWVIRPSHNVWGNLEILQSNAMGGNPVTAGTSRFVISPAGNVGIGTTGPVSLLQLANQGTFTLGKGLTFGDGDTGFYEQSDDLMRIAHNGSPIWEISSTRIGGTDRGGGAILNESPSAANPTLVPSTEDDDTGIAHDGATNTNILTIVTGGVERVRVDNNGNVGIGKIPSARLHILGLGPIGGAGLRTGAQENVVVESNGNAYVNISTPPNNFAGYHFSDSDANGIGGMFYDHSLDKLSFRANGSSERMVIDSSGRVGIGMTCDAGQPTASLCVSGNIAAKYQDLAEWVPASESISAGTVLIIDSDHLNQVKPSLHAYDTRIAGVVSDKPGILLGEAGEGKVKVATTGRVKIKADATHQPINAGDLLVTSDNEGYAMRSEPIDFGGIRLHRPGTILGKALESLSEGTGEILVLLTLQ